MSLRRNGSVQTCDLRYQATVAVALDEEQYNAADIGL